MPIPLRKNQDAKIVKMKAVKSDEEVISKNNFIMIPEYVELDNSISFQARVLFGRIAVLCHKFGYCYATNEYFCKIYNVSRENTVSGWIKELLMKNYIDVTYIPSENGRKRKITLGTIEKPIAHTNIEYETGGGYIEKPITPYNDLTINEGGVYRKTDKRVYRKTDNIVKNIISRNKYNNNNNDACVVEGYITEKPLLEKINCSVANPAEQVAKPSKEVSSKEPHFFNESPYSVFDFFESEFLRKFPKYQMYDLAHYHNSMVNWKKSNASKYKKSDWLTTAKNWIDIDLKKGTAYKKGFDLALLSLPFSEQTNEALKNWFSNHFISQEATISTIDILKRYETSYNGFVCFLIEKAISNGWKTLTNFLDSNVKEFISHSKKMSDVPPNSDSDKGIIDTLMQIDKHYLSALRQGNTYTKLELNRILENLRGLHKKANSEETKNKIKEIGIFVKKFIPVAE